MTKTSKTSNAKTTAAHTDDAKAIIMNTVEALQENIAVPEAAREFVAQQAATAQQQAEAAHESVAQFNTQAEKAAVSFAGSYANFTKSLIDMTAAIIRDAFATVEKVATAKSLPDAMQIQADFVRNSSKANLERLKDVAETAKDTMAQVTATARESAAKAMAHGNKAA